MSTRRKPRWWWRVLGSAVEQVRDARRDDPFMGALMAFTFVLVGAMVVGFMACIAWVVVDGSLNDRFTTLLWLGVLFALFAGCWALWTLAGDDE